MQAAANNTFVNLEQSFSVVEVGDSKQLDFYPQMKVMRWDNEANFSVRLVHDESAPIVNLVGNQVQWEGENVAAHFYTLGDGGEETGGYEFEIILKAPPKSNVINLTMETKGLDFFYQSPLTQEEIDRGVVRPANVVGSYAVYHQTMSGDYSKLGGQNYKTGKAFHIYRPQVQDTKGVKVWADLFVDVEKGLVSVTIPQDFIDKATYPVSHAAGFTIGNTGIGASNEFPPTAYVQPSDRTQAADSGVVQKLTVYAYQDGATGVIKLGVYDDNAGEPNNLVAQDDTGVQLDLVEAKWTDSNTINSGNITATNYYWLAFLPSGGQTPRLWFDAAGARRYANPFSFLAITNHFGSIPISFALLLCRRQSVANSFKSQPCRLVHVCDSEILS